jgi:EmrB/QacA subfamily drug resistance transporter
MDSATTVALPAISQRFGMDAIELSWVRMAYLLSAAVCLVPFGKLADMFGRKRFFRYGIAVFTVAALLSGLSISSSMLIASRAVLGIGSAMIFGTGVAILTSSFPPGERGRVLGINVAAVYLGLSLGPSIGGVLTGFFGWRSIFLFAVPLGLVALAFAVWRLEGEWAEARGEIFDLRGSVLYALSLMAVMFGFSRLPRPQGIGLLLAGLAGLALFGLWELRARYPVLNIRLFARNRPFAFSNVAALINYSATSAVAFLLSLYLQYIRRLSPQQAGLVLIAQPAVQVLLSPAAGRLSDRVEARIVASAGMACTAAGLVSLFFVGPATPIWQIVARLGLLGLGFGLFSSPNMSAIMGSVDRRHYSIASGMLATMRMVGQTLSMGITLLLFSVFIGQVELAPPVYPAFFASMKTTFAIFAVLCVAGIFASLARGNVKGEDTHAPRAEVEGPAPSDHRP